MSSLNKKVFFEDYTFLVDARVYEPAEDSFLFAENLATKEARRVIDVGAGCGILGIIAARKANEVVAVDVNPHAVHCAKQNARLNRLASRMIFIQGDLFRPFMSSIEFDLIIFNAPYLPLGNEDGSWLEHSWVGGYTGREVVDRFVSDAPRHLSQNGQILLMQSSLSNVEKTLRRFKKEGLAAKIVAGRNLPFFEKIVLISAKRPKKKK
jgi:release factor glutamine methyltransferase